MKLHGLADKFVRADEDVDLTLFEVGQQLLDLLGLAGAAQVVDPDGEVVQSLTEGAVVLEGQHRGGHEHGGLLAVGSGLEGGTHGNLGLAESHVTADEAVHGFVALHVGLDGLCGSQLVGCVFVDKRGLQLLLQVAVGRVGKSLLLASGGIEADEFAGDVLEAALGARLHLRPGVGAQAVEPRSLTFLAAVFREFVQRVDRDIGLISVLVGEFDHLLRGAVHRGAYQSAEPSHAQVLMDDVVSLLDLVEFLEREGQFA